MKSKIVLFLLFALCRSQLCAYEFAYQFRNYDVSDGLPSSQVYGLLEDKGGNIWFGTDHGIVKYNGYEFKTYTVDDGLSIDVVFHLDEGPDGRIWCYGKDHRVHFFEEGRFHPYPYNDSLVSCFDNSTNVIDLRVSEKGLLLNTTVARQHCAARSGYSLKRGFFKNAESGIRITSDEFGLSISAKSVIKQREIEIFGTPYLLDGTNITKYEFADICYYGSTCFFSVENYLFKYDMDQNEKVELIEVFPNRIHTIDTDVKGNLWIGFKYDGLWKISGDDFQSRECLLANVSVADFLIDRNQGIWVSTLYKGLFYCENQEVKTLSLPGHLSILELQELDGRLYFMTPNEMVYELDYQQEIPFIFSTELARERNWETRKYLGFSSVSKRLGYILDVQKRVYYEENVCNKLIESEKSFYFLSAKGIGSMEKNKNHYTIFVSSQFLNCATPGIDCDLLIGTDNGVRKFKKEEAILLPAAQASFTDSRYDIRMTDYEPETPFFREKMRDIMNISDTIIVFGAAQQGVYIQRSKQPDLWLKEEDGLVSNSVNKLYYNAGNLVVITNRGISVIHEQRGIVNYSSKNGLTSNDVKNVAIRNDTLWVVSANGTSLFSLDKQQHNGVIVNLNEVSVDGERLEDQSFYELAYNNRTLDVRYEGISFPQEGNITYKCRLTGVDDGWRYTNSRTLRYNNLPAGEFEFWIAAQNIDETWEEPVCLFKLSKAKPFWKEIWFLTLTFFALLGLIWLVIDRRYRHHQKIQEEELRVLNMERKTLQAQMNPHFLFNSLTSLQSLILDDRKTESQDYLGKFAHLTRLALNHSTKNAVTLIEELDILKSYIDLERFRFNNVFEYEIEVLSLPDNLLIPPMLVQPFVENAILHGLSTKKENGLLRISYMKRDTNYFCIIIHDNGRGRSVQSTLNGHKSLGIQLVQDRLSVMKNRAPETKVEIIDLVENNQPFGTKVILTLPLKLEK